MRRQLELLRDLIRMVLRRKLWFLVPLVSLLLFGIFLLVALQSPALIPFFYMIF